VTLVVSDRAAATVVQCLNNIHMSGGINAKRKLAMKSLVPSDLPPSSSTSANPSIPDSCSKNLLAFASAALLASNYVSANHHDEQQPLDGTIQAALYDFELVYGTSQLVGLDLPVTNVSSISDIRAVRVNGEDIWSQLHDKIPGGIFTLTAG
jgi:hypothetical protein